MGKKIIIFLLILIVSFLLLNSGLILILIQNIKNIVFYSENNKEIIAEKLIYEQFSHEIYSNINSKIFIDIKNMTIKEDCDEGYELIKFPIRIDYLYDCEGVYDDKLDKNECQNRITNPRYCCELSCCKDYVIKKERYHFCSDSKSFSNYDSRNGNCSKISIYNGKFYYINNFKYCGKRLSKTYEELLSEFDESKNCNNQFDTAGHYFCSDDYNYNNPSSTIIVENVFSMIPPNYINIENSFRILLLLNKKNYEESKVLNELKKLNETSIKNIEKAFKKENDSFINYYKEKNIFKLAHLISGNEPVFEKFKNNNFLKSGNIIWYTRNYIGFENFDELQKFKKYFDENDYKNNSLYKISTSAINFYFSIISIIIIGILFISEIIYLIYLIKKRKEFLIIEVSKKISVYFLITSSISFAFFLIIYLTCFIYKFDSIEIHMELFFQRVIEKYMERRNQLFLREGVISLFANFIFISAFVFYISKISFKSKEVINSRPNNILLVKFRLKEGDCEHKIKMDENKILKHYIKSFENILEKCKKCSDNFFGIEKILLNGVELNTQSNIKDLRLSGKSILIIDDES